MFFQLQLRDHWFEVGTDRRAVRSFRRAQRSRPTDAAANRETHLLVGGAKRADQTAETAVLSYLFRGIRGGAPFFFRAPDGADFGACL
jgi:hypothetical protein